MAGNNPSIVIQIKILQSHSFLPLVSSLSTTDSSRRDDRDKKKIEAYGKLRHGRVLRASGIKSGGHGFKSRSDY